LKFCKLDYSDTVELQEKEKITVLYEDYNYSEHSVEKHKRIHKFSRIT